MELKQSANINQLKKIVRGVWMRTVYVHGLNTGVVNTFGILVLNDI